MVELEERVDYSSVNRSVGGFGSFAKEFDADHFTPQHGSVKVTHHRPDKLGSDDRT